jgi:hypothetical protein
VTFCQIIYTAKPPVCKSDPFYNGLAVFSKIFQVSSFCAQKFPPTPAATTTTVSTTGTVTSFTTDTVFT